MTRLRSIVFGVYFYIVTTLCVILFAPTLLLPDRYFRPFASLWAKMSLAGFNLIVGVTVRVEGEDRLPDRPFILASKHQSTWETLYFCEYFDLPPFVLKQELQDIPMFGRYLQKLGNIAVDREGGASSLKKMIADALKVLRDGRVIIIFPEGTRTKPGEKHRYHPGVAALYTNTGYEIVPATLNSGLCWPRSIWNCTPGVITVRFMEHIPQGMKRRELLHTLEERVDEATLVLDQETSSD